MTTSEQVWARLLRAIEARDVPGLVACFAPNGSWQNVPHEPWVGRATIASMLAPILQRSERVQWDVVTASFAEHRAWIERVDRFWIDGVEYAVRCNGVIDLDSESGLIKELRDYVDLGEWRGRLRSAGPLSTD